MTSNICQLLSRNSYPGRGILLGNTADGLTVAAYFIMGRSVNSRNRIFVEEPDGIRTEAHDPALLSDPHLIIYHPVRQWRDRLIVTNGDQTDTIRDFLSNGDCWENALRTRLFEDDRPNWTPRISGLLEADGSCRLSILKAADPDGKGCDRFFYEYPPQPGKGHFIHTYIGNGSPLPSFAGEPIEVTIPGDIDIFTNQLWENLDKDNKISLFVRYTDPTSGKFQQRIINRY